MSSSQYPLRQSGIFRNLPSFDPALKGLKAIVCGATGISGFHVIKALLDTPDRWSKIYALSRSPLSKEILAFLTEEQRSRIQHISIDFSSSGEQIAKSLKDAGASADYVFYYAYISPKAGKNLLEDFCQENSETDWSIVMPTAIVGATQYPSMNMFLSFGVYTAVQAHKKEPLRFGGDWAPWQFNAGHSTAQLTDYLSEWAALEEQCKNQRFNAQDGGLLSWDRFYHKLAHESKYQVMDFAGRKDAPLGHGPPLNLRLSYPLVKWSEEPSTTKAWEEMMAQSNGQLQKNLFAGNSQDVFMGNFSFLPFGTFSTNKTRRFGFCGCVDTLESIFEMYQQIEKLGMLPPMKVDAARPLI
ncbi:hypothetical protein EJ02DRAFT_511085 [Clathrospora elynae]|uniref:NAD(P)-binding protein n=1 Tax=Clathrospora elynae TaxID=706981 RepID=A0A6A5SRK7_9PLEO|nr:hypothetical protein EJ02DRAFT_511085 [Clathrospora elynae]